MKRLLTIGHSYVVAANRALAHQMAVAGRGEWSVTAVAPDRYRGDLREIRAEAIPGEASSLHTVPMRFDRVPHLMWFGGKARRLLSAEWDVVHCWEEPYVLAAAQIARAIRPSATLIVGTFQNISKSYPWPLSAFERRTMGRADGWVAFGRSVHEALAQRPGYRETPCRVIPPGVDLDRFRPDVEQGGAVRERLGWPADAVVVGFLGRFVEQKGLPMLLDALGRARCRWHALFVGGGPLEGPLRRFADAHPGRVHIATGVSHHDVPPWLNAMTMMCAPSQTTPRWREQFGRMLIEAMACGVPAITADSGEMPAVVGDAGVVVGERDTAAWAATIDRLAADPHERHRLAARGLERAHSHYAWPVVARAHLDFFAALREGRAA
jgi:glycosyltransferase involved in cell wall biosynthesis